jgi:hypothetical protein
MAARMDHQEAHEHGEAMPYSAIVQIPNLACRNARRMRSQKPQYIYQTRLCTICQILSSRRCGLRLTGLQVVARRLLMIRRDVNIPPDSVRLCLCGRCG